MLRKFSILAAVAIAFTTVSCNSSNKGFETPIHAEWSIHTLNGYEGTSLADHHPTLRMVLANVNGTAGCNQYNGRFSMTDNKLTFNSEAFALTKKMCPIEVMEVEDLFLHNMGEVASWKIDGTELQLLNEEGKTVIVASYVKAIDPNETK